jgi:hypothetical protein
VPGRTLGAIESLREIVEPVGQRRVRENETRGLFRGLSARPFRIGDVDLASVIAGLRAAGVASQRGIAAALNERSIPTVAGSGRWYDTQVGGCWRDSRGEVKAEMTA